MQGALIIPNTNLPPITSPTEMLISGLLKRTIGYITWIYRIEGKLESTYECTKFMVPSIGSIIHVGFLVKFATNPL